MSQIEVTAEAKRLYTEATDDKPDGIPFLGFRGRIDGGEEKRLVYWDGNRQDPNKFTVGFKFEGQAEPKNYPNMGDCYKVNMRQAPQGGNGSGGQRQQSQPRERTDGVTWWTTAKEAHAYAKSFCSDERACQAYVVSFLIESSRGGVTPNVPPPGYGEAEDEAAPF